MSKILVADDNSNVQKTVALALTGLDMEIVAVNNGEAAVRKLASFTPDLILADIFMPVRNGYEVCEYVKKDARFTHVPVVLLVGAFDPLDEREAQRVGADGILKKPFVPPNPLLTMVKTLLGLAAGERLMGVSASKTPLAAEGTAAEANAADHGPVPEVFAELSAQEFPAPIEHVSPGESEPSMGETVTGSRDATLGEPIFWRAHSSKAEAGNGHSMSSPVDVKMDAAETGEDSPPAGEESSIPEPAEQFEIIREAPDETPISVVDMEPIEVDQAAPVLQSVDAGNSPELTMSPADTQATEPEGPSDLASETTTESAEPIVEAAGTADTVETSVSEISELLELVPEPDTRSSEQATPQAAPPCAQPPAPVQDIAPATPANPPEPAAPDPALVEAVTQRVLDRMRPQVLDIITNELLRPVVLALVRREIERR